MRGSGWIKIEKSLEHDLRLRRIARKLTDDNERGVSLALGALIRLWVYADTYIDEDDTLCASVDEIDQLTGITGFCAMLPSEWLQVIDANTIKLPGYQTHNGPAAKTRALTNARVARWRDAPPLPHVTHVRYQTRQDKTIQDKNKRAPVAPFVAPNGLDQNAWARWIAYRSDLKKPIRAASMQAAADEMAKLGGAQMSAVTQSMANGWQGLFAPKPAPGAPLIPTKTPDNRNSGEWMELHAAARAIGHRAPYEHESANAYRISVKGAEASARMPARDLRVGLAGLTAKMKMT